MLRVVEDGLVAFGLIDSQEGGEVEEWARLFTRVLKSVPDNAFPDAVRAYFSAQLHALERALDGKKQVRDAKGWFRQAIVRDYAKALEQVYQDQGLPR